MQHPAAMSDRTTKYTPILRHEHHQPHRTEANQTRKDQTREEQTKPDLAGHSRITKPRTTTRSHTRPKPNLNFKQYLSFYLNFQLYIIHPQQCSPFRQTEILIALFSDEYVDFGGQGSLHAFSFEESSISCNFSFQFDHYIISHEFYG